MILKPYVTQSSASISLLWKDSTNTSSDNLSITSGSSLYCKKMNYSYRYSAFNSAKHPSTSCVTNYISSYSIPTLDTWYTKTLPVVINVGEKLREIIRSNMAPKIIGAIKSLCTPQDIREIRARQTLKMILGEEKYLNYLKRGLVSVQAKSGLIYVIYPGDKMTLVIDNGVRIKKLCSYLSGSFTPTDSVLTKYCMILHDEDNFVKQSNAFDVTPKHDAIISHPPTRPLLEAFKFIKQQKELISPLGLDVIAA